jgi:hypothetical protein
LDQAVTVQSDRRPSPELTPWQELLRSRLDVGAEDLAGIVAAIEHKEGDEGGPDPQELVTRMGRDTAVRDAIAYADSVVVLQVLGSERASGWTVDPDRSGPLGAGSVGVEWVYEAFHNREPSYVVTDPKAPFLGMPPTDNPVEAHGFSIFGVEGGVFTVRRYIDWAGLYGQLGLTLNWRVPVDG